MTGRALAWAAMVVLGSALPVHAQVVRGTLTERGSGVPLDGAVLALVPAGSDSAYVRALSDAAGGFSLQAPAGRWRLRAELIGHRTVYSDVFEASDQDVVLRLTAPVEPVSLQGVAVTAAERRCVVRPTEEGLRTATAWQQARKALESSFLARETDATRFEAVLYERDLDPGSLRVREEHSESYRAEGPRPFRGVSPESLAADGFVQVTDSGTIYFAPDERVLLSDVFLDGHCFRLHADEPSDELLGLRFEPVGGTEVTDIEGVLWLERATGELRSLDFRYVNLRLGVPTDRLGGGVRFQRLPGGGWIARRWWIRMPIIEIEHTRVLGRARQRVALSGIRERGGEVLAVETAGVRLEDLARPRVQGVVFDSTRAVTLGGAEVVLVGTGHATRTDRFGRFALTAPEGDFLLTFQHPRLDTLGFVPEPIAVEMRPEVVRRARLAIPSSGTLLARACGPQEGPVLAGVVRDGRGLPLPGARVSLGWPAQERPSLWRTERSDSLGRFVFCGAPPTTDVVVRAVRDGLTSPPHLVRVEAHAHARAELVVDTLRTAALGGIVSDAATGRALADVSVLVAGTGQAALTNPRGEFVLQDVPPGRQVLEFDHLLYGAQAEAVEVEPGSAVSFDVSLDQGAIELEPLTVSVEALPLPGVRGFTARAQSGIGYFLTEEQITRLQPVQMTDVLNAVPGLTVACGDPSVLGSGCRVQFERARALDPSGRERSCPVQYFLDGSPVSAELVETLRPANVRGIEVYSGLSDVPPELRRGPDTRCGVIAVWLKGRR